MLPIWNCSIRSCVVSLDLEIFLMVEFIAEGPLIASVISGPSACRVFNCYLPMAKFSASL